MKKCPYCAEEIQDEAVKCRYCGEWLDKISYAKTDEHIDSIQSIDITNSDNLLEDGEKIIEGKIAISNAIEDSFRTFKRMVILMYLGMFILGGASIYNDVFKPFAVFGYVILFFYFWSHLWSCARLVGKNPFLWILLTGMLSILGPVVAYQTFKSSAENQGFIIKPKEVNRYS